MIVPLGPLQWFRLSLKGRSLAPNYAPTPSGILSGRSDYPFTHELRRALASPQRRAAAWTFVRDGETIAVASAGRMSGPKSWQVTQLLLADGLAPHAQTTQDAVSELLEHASSQAARAGAERVFLRMDVDSPWQTAARRSGFFPIYREVLTELPRADANRHDAIASPLREVSRQDEYALFRLYSAAVPPDVRRVVGMTFDQWRDSRERAPGRSREHVLDGERGLRGWLRVGRVRGQGYLQAMAGPSERGAANALAAFALAQTADARNVLALAAEYEAPLLTELRDRGFVARRRFVMSARRLAVAVPARAAASAPAAW